LPSFGIDVRPVQMRRRAVQQKTFDMVRMQVLEGAGERLRHLLRRPHGGIVRKSMVLPVAVGELRLEKKFGAADAAARNCFGERSTHSSFKIMLALVGS